MDAQYVALLNAVRGQDVPAINRVMAACPSDKHRATLLKMRSPYIMGPLPFMTIMMFPKIFPVLMHSVPESMMADVLAVLEDGNTALSEAVSWGARERVQAFLRGLQPWTRAELLRLKDFQGETLEARILRAEGKEEEEEDEEEEDEKKGKP